MQTATTLNETAAREYAKIAGITAGAVIVVSIPLSLTGAMIASALGYDAALVGGSIFAAAMIGAAYVGYDALQVARWMMVQQIATHLAKHDAETKKTNAEAERILAEADRLDAESAAIKIAAERSAAQVNVNSGSGKMIVKNQPIKYTVAGQIVNGNQLNQIDQTPRTLHLEAADVLWFCEQLANGYGHSKSKWVNRQELPYSRLPVTYEIYKSLIDAITEAGGIVGRGERASGRLIETQPAQLVKMIEATHPDAGAKGITLELPALP